jgi:methionine sulfoxide reductase heme-binding subunit
MTGPAPIDYGWWLASRTSAIIAFGLVAASVGIGLAMAGRVARRPGLAPRLRAVHEHCALVALLLVAVHAATLLGDRWLHPGLRGIAVPFAMSYRPLATGLGILAAYLAAALGLSFYARRRIGARRWRRVHRLAVVVYALGLVHAIGAGTDTRAPWLRAVLLATAVPIGALFARRVATGLRRRPAAVPRRAVAPGESRA